MKNNIDNVCVCVCFWNTNPKYLEECFKSIDVAVWMFKRYYGDIPIEVHVMDDGTDNIETINMFEKILQQYKYIKWWRHDHNITLATAINDLHEYTPDNALVIYIDSDDMMVPNRIIVQYEVMTKYKWWNDITLCATNTCTPNNIIRNNIDVISKYFKYEIFDNIDNMKENVICHPSIAYKINDIRLNNIKYDDNFKCIQDFDFYLQLLSKHLKILLISDTLTWWRQYTLEEKPDKYKNYYKELCQLREKYNINNLLLVA